MCVHVVWECVGDMCACGVYVRCVYICVCECDACVYVS